MKAILDMDPGHDDALATFLALANPDMEVLAITCCAGNVPLHRTTINARIVLDIAGRTDVPVAAGLPRPLLRELRDASDAHGKTGMDGPELPEPSFALVDEHAVDLLARLARESEEPVVLIPIGPLTNIATTFMLHPEILGNIERIVLMGGAFGEGNVTPSAEFNIWADPEAAQVVFDSGVPLTMVGLDVTHKAVISEEEQERIRAIGNRVSTFAADLLGFYSRFHRRHYGWNGTPVHDACAVAEVLRPGIISTRPAYVQVETGSELTRGATVCDFRGVTGKPHNASVGMDIDRGAFVNMLITALESYS